MKYLKSINESVNLPYTVVPFSKDIEYNLINFTDKEIAEIQTIFANLDSCIISVFVTNYNKSVIGKKTIIDTHDKWHKRGVRPIYVNLYKNDDEWYYLSDMHKHLMDEDPNFRIFKCDQLEGLLDCLRHLKISYQKANK